MISGRIAWVCWQEEQMILVISIMYVIGASFSKEIKYRGYES